MSFLREARAEPRGAFRGERALAESDLAPLERALLSALGNKRRVPVLELVDGEDDPVAAPLVLRQLEARGHIELSGDIFVALGFEP